MDDAIALRGIRLALVPAVHHALHRLGLRHVNLPWQCLYFLPEPQGQGSLRPTFSVWRTLGCCFFFVAASASASSPPPLPPPLLSSTSSPCCIWTFSTCSLSSICGISSWARIST